LFIFRRLFQTEENKISLDRLYEYFKELNSSENEASSDDFSRIYSQNGVDLLNSEITENEVIKAVKNLKKDAIRSCVSNFLAYSL
jgi:hypothetical protein